MPITATQLCDTTDMVVVHRVFQREFRLLPRMVRAVQPGANRRASEIADHVTDITRALHDHHGNEDELLWPRLAERAQITSEIVGRLQRQHEALAEPLGLVESMLVVWRHTADRELGIQLADVLTRVSTLLDEHLIDEEQTILPMAEQHVTQAEWDELRQRGVAAMSKSRRLIFLGYILEEATSAERAMMLEKVPRPARIAYALVGERRSRRRTARLRRELSKENLDSGGGC